MSMGDDYQEDTPPGGGEDEQHPKEKQNAVLNRLELLLKVAGLKVGYGSVLAPAPLRRPSESALAILSYVYGSLGSNSYLLTSLACR